MELPLKLFDPKQMFTMQARQYPDRVYMSSGAIAAGATVQVVQSVSSNGHFFCQYITGRFSSQSTAGAVVDDGITYLRGLLRDGAHNLPLFSDRIPLDLWLTPGRRKTLAAGGAGNPLFFPLELNYLFRASGSIIVEATNDSDVANTFEICFHGIRIKV